MDSSAAAATKKKSEKKHYWTEEEDRILEKYIELNGDRKWEQVSKNTGLCEAGKTGNSCLLRWTNHLKPGVYKGPFTEEEDYNIIRVRKVIFGGDNRWSRIAEHLPGRTDNDIKNRWNTILSRRLMISELETDQDLLADEPDVNQQPFEESINTGGLSRVNDDQEILSGYINAHDFNQFSLRFVNSLN